PTLTGYCPCGTCPWVWCGPSATIRYRQSTTLTTRPRVRSRRARAATRSASSHHQAGVRETSIPARWWNSVRTNPGQRASTRTPCPATAPAIDTLKFVTQALVAEYVEPGETGAKPATEETL